MQYPSTGTHTTARTATTDPLVGGPLSQSQSDDDSGCRVSDDDTSDDSGCDTNLYDHDDVATDSFSPPLTPTPRRSTALPIYKTSEPDGFAAEVERRLRAGSESPDGVDNTNFYDHDDATTDCGSPRSAYEYDDVVAGVDGRGPEYVEPCSSDEGGSDLESDDEDEGFENDNDRVARVGNHTTSSATWCSTMSTRSAGRQRSGARRGAASSAGCSTFAAGASPKRSRIRTTTMSRQRRLRGRACGAPMTPPAMPT